MSRDFEEKYDVIKSGKPFDPKPVISLFEGHHDNDAEPPPARSFVQLLVKEQMRLMATGKSKEDSLTVAVELLQASNKDLEIRPKASFEYSCVMI